MGRSTDFVVRKTRGHGLNTVAYQATSEAATPLLFGQSSVELLERALLVTRVSDKLLRILRRIEKEVKMKRETQSQQLFKRACFDSSLDIPPIIILIIVLLLL